MEYAYSIVFTFVTPPFPTENHGNPRKSLVNSIFELEKSRKKENYGVSYENLGTPQKTLKQLF